MKILCISDEVDPLIYSVNLKERHKDVDLVISCGDLNLEYYEYIISSLNKDVLFVFGNHNLKYLHLFQRQTGLETIEKEQKRKSKWVFGGVCIEDNIVYNTKTKLLIMGVGGCMKYNNGLHQFTETKMKLRLVRLIPKLLYNKARYGRYLDVFVTHAPARNVGDGVDQCHKGFECFNWFIKKFKPKYFLHGHVHLIDMNQRPITKIGDSTVINVFKSYVLEVEND